MTVLEMVGKRAQLFERSKAMLDSAIAAKRNLSESEQREYDAMQGEMDSLRERIQAAKLTESEDKLLSQSRGRQTQTEVRSGPEDFIGGDVRHTAQALAFRAWCAGPRLASAAMVRAAEGCGVSIQRAELEARSLSIGTTTAGGAGVQSEMVRAYVEMQKWFGPVRNVATVINTETGSPLAVPTVDDTANVGAILAEGTAATTTVDPTFGVVTLGAYKYSSKAVIASWELIQDLSFPLPQYLGRELGTRVARITNQHFTTGSGTGQPKGVVTASTVGATAAATNAITFDEVIDLERSLDPAYRPRGAFMLHDSTAAHLRKLKDSQNRFLWELSTIAGQPDRLDGYPVIVNNDMDTIATAKKVILFGDFSRYYIREAGGPVFMRSDDLYFLQHQSAFLAYLRADGNLIDTSAVKHLITHA